MRTSSAFWPWASGLVLLAACGKGDPRPVAVADSARDLQLAPVDTSVPLADVPAAADSARVPAPETVYVEKPAAVAPQPAPKPAATAPTPAASVPAEPAAPVVRTLAAGTKFTGYVIDSIDSKTSKAGDVVKIRVSDDVKDAEGRTVIPAGATVSAEITVIKWSENKGDPGTLKFATGSVSSGSGNRKAIVATVSKPEFLYRKRGGALGDASKVAGGAAAGAVVGGLLGKGTGAAIGGVLGGAVGTQRAVETKDRDIIVKPGSTVTLTLKEDFER